MTDAYVLGDTVRLTFVTQDGDGDPYTATTATLTVAEDGGSPSSVTVTESTTTGVYEALYLTTAAGAFTATFTYTGAGAAPDGSDEPGGVLTDRFLVVGADPANLTVAMLRDYLVDTSATDAEIGDALLAERFAQAQRCRTEPYTPDLLQALKRRVARNLAARRVPVATFTAFDGGQTSQRVPAHDAEIRRLESPYRRRPVG